MIVAYSRNGRIEQIVTLPPGDDGMAHLASLGPEYVMDVLPQMVDIVRYWRSPSGIEPRPAPPAPPSLTAAVAASWAGLPVGAVVEAIDPISGDIAGFESVGPTGSVQIALPAGPWTVVVNEAFPALPETFQIEVLP
jgi:hypothetical protein